MYCIINFNMDSLLYQCWTWWILNVYGKTHSEIKMTEEFDWLQGLPGEIISYILEWWNCLESSERKTDTMAWMHLLKHWEVKACDVEDIEMHWNVSLHHSENIWNPTFSKSILKNTSQSYSLHKKKKKKLCLYFPTSTDFAENFFIEEKCTTTVICGCLT